MREVASSVDELLATATWRGPMDKHVDSLSGSSFERAVVDGQACVVKHVGYHLDWLARALGDTDCWALTLWRTGLLDALPDRLDHTGIIEGVYLARLHQPPPDAPSRVTNLVFTGSL